MIFLYLSLFFLAWFLKILILDRPPKEPPKNHTFTAAIKYGELEVVIQYDESNPENPFLPRAQRTIELWAIEREDRTKSKELHLAVEGEVKRHFPECRPTVISVKVLKVEPEPPETPIEVSRAEQVKAELTSDADTIQEIGDTINNLRETRKDLWDNRRYPGTDKPIGHHLHEKADALIRGVLHGSKRR